MDNIRIAEDGFICVTDLLDHTNKKWWKYSRLKSTKQTLIVLAEELDLDEVYRIQGGVGKCTWVHPRVAIYVATWADVDFGIQVVRWLKSKK